MQFKSSKEIEFPGKYWLILLVYFLIILIGFIIAGQFHWIFYLIFIVVVTIFCSLVIWQEYILPDFTLTDHFFLSKYILINQFIKSLLFLSVRNGEIEGDYALLKKKPNIRIINIDQKSAAIIEDSSNQKSLLLHGVHVLSKNSKITGVFYLGIRSIQIGPVGKNALDPKRIQESLAEYHSRISSAEKTKTELLSGELIYPSFTIFYRFDTNGLYENDLELFINLTRLLKGDNSPLNMSQEFEKYLTNETHKNWNIFCKNKKIDDILSAFPGKIESANLRIKGVISRIYIDHIY